MTAPATVADLVGRGAMPACAVAVVAHPDDESFGLGALLAALVDAGVAVSIVCLTAGEASTLGAGPDLAARRDRELQCASAALGLEDVVVAAHRDGHLAEVDDEAVDAFVDAHTCGADLLVVFEPSGVTGHPDHRAATASALRVAASRGTAVLEWGVAGHVAAALRDELGVPFAALDGGTDVVVDRSRQLAAIECHESQATANAVLVRRLALEGDVERVRYVAARG